MPWLGISRSKYHDCIQRFGKVKQLYNPLSVSRDAIFTRQLDLGDFPIQAEPLHIG